MAQRYRDDGTKQNAEKYCCSEDNKIGIFRGMNHSANQGRKSFDGGLGTGYFKRIAALNDGARAAVERLAPLVGRMIHPTEDTDFIVLGTAIFLGVLFGAVVTIPLGHLRITLGTSVGTLLDRKSVV